MSAVHGSRERASLEAIHHGAAIQFIADVPRSFSTAEYAMIRAGEMLYRGLSADGGTVFYPEVEPLLIAQGALSAFEDMLVARAVGRAHAFYTRGSLVKVHVNVTAGHVESGRTRAALDKALAEHPELPRWMVVVEVTETENWSNLDTAERALRSLKDEIGVGLALDDLGSGRTLELITVGRVFDTMKIDIALTRQVDLRPAARDLARRLVDLAGDLGADVIVEGVEPEGVGWWRWHGVTRFQSFAFAKPIDDQEAVNALLDLTPSLPLLSVP